jgi:hypothetical protein
MLIDDQLAATRVWRNNNNVAAEPFISMYVLGAL